MDAINACPSCERRERDALLVSDAIAERRETLGHVLPEDERQAVEREEMELDALLQRIIARRAA
jgi:hypothetical protein